MSLRKYPDKNQFLSLKQAIKKIIYLKKDNINNNNSNINN